MNQFLHFVAAITFFSMSAKHNVSGPSTFYRALKTLEKSTHFMLTHVIVVKSPITPRSSLSISIIFITVCESH